jgi:hypothetical protein
VLSSGTGSGTVLSLWFEPLFDDLGLWHVELRLADGSLADRGQHLRRGLPRCQDPPVATWDEFTGHLAPLVRNPDRSALGTSFVDAPTRATTGLRLGSDPAGHGHGQLTGVLDELRIYQGAMTITSSTPCPRPTDQERRDESSTYEKRSSDQLSTEVRHFSRLEELLEIRHLCPMAFV